MAFFDVTDNMAGQNSEFGAASEKNGAIIQFYHIATFRKSVDAGIDNGSQATFKAFLTDFNDSFKTNWNPKETMGRMDPIQTYKNTQRQISIAFDVPSHSEDESQFNFIQLQKLIMMQYPVYETTDLKNISSTTSTQAQPIVTTETTPNFTITKTILQPSRTNSQNSVSNPQGRFITSPPLLYIKFMNWVSEDIGHATGERDFYGSDALVGIVSEVSFKPDLEQGFHFINNNLVPKLFTVSLNISVVHTQELGWTKNVIGSGQELETHLFGQPIAIPGKEEGFATYPIFPYKTDTFYYRKKK
jgi:hypothetical protein